MVVYAERVTGPSAPALQSMFLCWTGIGATLVLGTVTAIVATTVNLNGYLLKAAAQDDATALADALDRADHHRPSPTDYRWPHAA
jgi:hypothetical protein